MPVWGSGSATDQRRRAWRDEAISDLKNIIAAEDDSRIVKLDKFIYDKVSEPDEIAVDMVYRFIKDQANSHKLTQFDWRYLELQFERQKLEFRSIIRDKSVNEAIRRQFRTVISNDELGKVLKDHQTWLWSGIGQPANLVGRRFKLIQDNVVLARADLRWADMTGSVLDRASFAGANCGWARFDGAYLPNSDFRNASLVGVRARGANLWQAKLYGANMWGADFQGALLIRSVFDPAPTEATDEEPYNLGPSGLGTPTTSDGFTDLTAVDFRDARMRDAKLATAFGAGANAFAGADLTNAQLPRSIEKFDDLAQASEALKNAQIIVATLLVTCVYVILVYEPIAFRLSTRYAFIAHRIHTASVKVPVINAEVPATVFAVVSPVIILALYTFLNSSLRRLWRAFAALPAIFPDGSALDERGYPSPIGGLVRHHLNLLKGDQSRFYKVERFVTGAIVNLTAPLTILLLLLFDGLKAVPVYIYTVHGAGLLVAMMICYVMMTSLSDVVADRRSRSVDRLGHAELRELVKVQNDQAQSTIRDRIRIVNSA